MKNKHLSFLSLLLGIIMITTSCDNSTESLNPDPNILGLWTLQNTEYKVTANDIVAAQLIKEDLTKRHPALRDSIQFFSTGYYNQNKMVVPHPLPQYEVEIKTLFTFKTNKNIVDIEPVPVASMSGFKARYTTIGNNMMLNPESTMLDYFKTGRYLHSIGLDSTKVSVTGITVTGHYERLLYYTQH